MLLQDWLVRLEREDGLPRIVVRRLDSGEEHVIDFPEEAYSLSIDGGYEFATDLLRFTYSSMTTPAEVWDYDLATRARRLRKRQEVPSGHDPADYVTRRLMAPTADGETVPISLLHRKGLICDHTTPLLLYGYGAYGISIPAAFATNRLSLVDRGFVYAIAHVRGGSEKGWRWYREGKLAGKPNTFRDFIAASEYLIAQGLTGPGRIVAHGGSAGGTLIGAVANMRPDLYAGMIAEVPFVDVLNTMLDEALPLTPPEWPEWGNPIRDAAAFRTILSYSPYENVRAQDYPAILALAGLTDPRVLYWEPAKWIARLRRLRTNDKLIAFRTNLDAGHSGAAGRFDRLKEVALAYAFAIKVARRKRIARTLCVAFDVVTQLRDRSEPQPALRQLRFDRSVRIEGIGHALDHTGFEDGNRSSQGRIIRGAFFGRAFLGGAPGVARRFLNGRVRHGVRDRMRGSRRLLAVGHFHPGRRRRRHCDVLRDTGGGRRTAALRSLPIRPKGLEHRGFLARWRRRRTDPARRRVEPGGCPHRRRRSIDAPGNTDAPHFGHFFLEGFGLGHRSVALVRGQARIEPHQRGKSFAQTLEPRLFHRRCNGRRRKLRPRLRPRFRWGHWTGRRDGLFDSSDGSDCDRICGHRRRHGRRHGRRLGRAGGTRRRPRRQQRLDALQSPNREAEADQNQPANDRNGA